MRHTLSLSTSLLTFIALSLPISAAAQSAPAASDKGETYERVYFDQYAPATALDMIRRIPGFNLSEANFGRGLGQGGANVLINGERLTGKTDVGSQLSRIAASNVVKIAIVDGATLDIPGLSGQVANITTITTGVSGTFEWTPEFRPGLEPNLKRGTATVSGDLGKLNYTIGLKNRAFRNGGYGPERLTDANGVLFETRDEKGYFYAESPGATVDLTWKPKDDHVGNLNFEINQFTFDGAEISHREAITTRGNTLTTVFDEAEDEWNMSIGADYEFPVPLLGQKGKLKTIGYYRFESSPRQSIFEGFTSATPDFGSRFFQLGDEAEAILRTEYSWAPEEGNDWQFGIEGAFNYLDIESSLQSLSNGVYVDQTLNDATSRVEEKRVEATLTHSRPITPKWDVQSSLGVEYSELSQTGGLTREFVRPKGFISTSYKPEDGKLWRAKIERQVGQLSFGDFISSVNIRDDFNTMGNVNLVPSQTWKAELAYERDFGQGNTWNTILEGNIISDLVDRIPVGVNGDAVGNIDKAYDYSIHSDLTLKGEKWNFDGVELNLGIGLHFSHVDDPLLGFDRRLNGQNKYHWNINFRHDIPKTDWAYGVEMNQNRNAPVYRLRFIQQYTFKEPFVGAFVEHKDIAGLRVNFALLNLLEGSDDFERRIFTDRRDIGVLDFTESRERDFGILARIKISGTF